MSEHKSNMIETTKTYGSGLLFAVFVGFSFLAIKVMIQYANAFQIIAYRYSFALIALLLCLAFKIIKVNFKGKPVLKKALPTATFYNLFILLQAAGLMYCSSIESGIIFAIIPIFVSIIASVFIKEKATLMQSAFMMLSITSLIIMILSGATSLKLHPAGIALLLLSSLSMAVYNTLTRYLRETFTSMEITTVIVVEGFVAFNILCVLLEIVYGDLSKFIALMWNPTFVLGGIYLGIPCTLLAAALMAYMIRRVAAVKATIFGNLATAISIVAGVLVLHEPLYWYHILCTAFILIGVIGVSVSGQKKKEEGMTT